MLSTDPKILMEEIEESQKVRNLHLSKTDEMIREYTGSYYNTDRKPDQPAPENHAFEWLARVTPEIIYDNPDINVKSRRSGIDPQICMKLQYGMQQWVENVSLWRTMTALWYDMAFAFAVAHNTFATIDHYPGSGGAKPTQPICRRIKPHRFFIDPQAESVNDARFMGHLWRRDKDDLLNDDAFDREAVSELVADSDLDKDQMPGTNNRNSGPARKEIIGYEIWIPEESLTDEEGFHGVIKTLACTQNKDGCITNTKWIREPRPFYGPKSGPYTMFGAYIVPNQIYPLSPLAATHAQVQELNSHATAASRSAASYKELAVYDKADGSNAAALNSAKHGSFVGIGGLKDTPVQKVGIGGVSKEQYEYIDRLRDRRDRSTGLSESDRGGSTSTKTATEVADRAEQRNSRISLLQRTFADCTEKVLQAAAWYMWNTETMVFPLGEDAALKINPRPQSLPPVEDAEKIAYDHGMDVAHVKKQLQWNPEENFAGGETLHGGIIPFEEMLIKINPRSMQRTNRPLEQAANESMASWMMAAMQGVPGAPDIDWVGMANQYGDSLGQKDFGRFIEPYVQRMREQLAAQEAQQAEMMQQGQPAGMADQTYISP